MADTAVYPAGMVLAALPRVWWSSLPLAADTEWATYRARPLDDQPGVDVDPDLRWLRDVPPVEPSIGDPDPDRDVTPLEASALDRLVDGRPLPPALRVLATEPDLQRRVRSATDAYLDLADHAVPTGDGGLLVHLLADSQHVLEWLVYVGPAGEAVVATDAWVGYEVGVGETDVPVPDVVPVDGSFALHVCADTVAEFVRRYWIENEIFFRVHVDQQPLDEVLMAYATAVGADGVEG